MCFTALVLAGCGRLPDGVDGDVVDGWEAMPEPELMTPAAGTCHDEPYTEAPRLVPFYRTVACTELHQIETVHVGTFEGEAAERNSSPNPGTPQWHAAYEECDEQAAEYLGEDFRYGWLWLGVAVPTDQAWRAGARWFRCDLSKIDQHDNFIWAGDTSLRGALADASDDLALGCSTVTLGEAEEDGDRPIEEQDPVPCDEPHQAEFVGVWVSESRYPDDDEDWSEVHAGCFVLVAEYVDVPLGSVESFRLGTIINNMSEGDWDNGNRGFRCNLWLDRELTRSLRGAGADALPPP
jgi:hypothetical protein